jgi:hypothetical protein
MELRDARVSPTNTEHLINADKGASAMKRTTGVVMLLAAIVLLTFAACGGADSGSEPVGEPDSASAGARAPGGGLTVEAALTTDAEGPLLVGGFLVAVESDTIRLCSVLAESFPPQCGEPSLLVENLDLATIEGLRSEGDVSWTDDQIELIGEVAKGVLAVDPHAL